MRKNRPPVAIVSSDPYAVKEVADECRFEVIPDPENPGETGAIEMATRVCVERGVDSKLVIPADIPLIEAWELEEFLKHAPAEGSVLVPAAMDAAQTPLSVVRQICSCMRFGNDSFNAHLAAAQATGKASSSEIRGNRGRRR